MTKKMNIIDWIAGILVVVGALNWGLVGIFEFNLVSFIFGEMSTLSRIVYVLVGLSGVWMIYTGIKCCQSCTPSGGSMS